jgi:hypothetical protein
MAPSYKKDLYNQTSYQRGVWNFRREAATINTLIQGLNDTRSDLRLAANAAITQHGVTHPDSSTLPLQTATAIPIGPSRAMVTLRYGPNPHGRGGYGGLDAFALANIQVSYTGLNKYKVKAGETHTDFHNWYYDTVVVPIFTITVFGAGTASPFNTIADNAGKTNANATSFSGYSCAHNTARYDGAEIDARNVDGVAQFSWKHVWTVLPSGWIFEKPSITSSTPGTVAPYTHFTFNGTATFPLT